MICPTCRVDRVDVGVWCPNCGSPEPCVERVDARPDRPGFGEHLTPECHGPMRRTGPHDQRWTCARCCTTVLVLVHDRRP